MTNSLSICYHLLHNKTLQLFDKPRAQTVATQAMDEWVTHLIDFLGFL
jgi:hypothetical protein